MMVGMLMIIMKMMIKISSSGTPTMIVTTIIAETCMTLPIARRM